MGITGASRGSLALLQRHSVGLHALAEWAHGPAAEGGLLQGKHVISPGSCSRV